MGDPWTMLYASIETNKEMKEQFPVMIKEENEGLMTKKKKKWTPLPFDTLKKNLLQNFSIKCPVNIWVCGL